MSCPGPGGPAAHSELTTPSDTYNIKTAGLCTLTIPPALRILLGGAQVPEKHRLVDIIAAAITKQAEAAGAARVVSATIKLSELASVTPEVLQACFARAAEPALRDIVLNVQIVPLLGTCERCQTTVEINRTLCCRRCGGPYVEIGDHNTVLLEACEFA